MLWASDLPVDCLVNVLKVLIYYYFYIILALKKTTVAISLSAAPAIFTFPKPTIGSQTYFASFPFITSSRYLVLKLSTLPMSTDDPHRKVDTQMALRVCECTPTHHLCSEFYAHRYAGPGNLRVCSRRPHCEYCSD